MKIWWVKLLTPVAGGSWKYRQFCSVIPLQVYSHVDCTIAGVSVVHLHVLVTTLAILSGVIWKSTTYWNRIVFKIPSEIALKQARLSHCCWTQNDHLHIPELNGIMRQYQTELGVGSHVNFRRARLLIPNTLGKNWIYMMPTQVDEKETKNLRSWFGFSCASHHVASLADAILDLAAVRWPEFHWSPSPSTVNE